MRTDAVGNEIPNFRKMNALEKDAWCRIYLKLRGITLDAKHDGELLTCKSKVSYKEPSGKRPTGEIRAIFLKKLGQKVASTDVFGLSLPDFTGMSAEEKHSWLHSYITDTRAHNLLSVHKEGTLGTTSRIVIDRGAGVPAWEGEVRRFMQLDFSKHERAPQLDVRGIEKPYLVLLSDVEIDKAIRKYVPKTGCSFVPGENEGLLSAASTLSLIDPNGEPWKGTVRNLYNRQFKKYAPEKRKTLLDRVGIEKPYLKALNTILKDEAIRDYIARRGYKPRRGENEGLLNAASHLVLDQPDGDTFRGDLRKLYKTKTNFPPLQPEEVSVSKSSRKETRLDIHGNPIPELSYLSENEKDRVIRKYIRVLGLDFQPGKNKELLTRNSKLYLVSNKVPFTCKLRNLYHRCAGDKKAHVLLRE